MLDSPAARGTAPRQIVLHTMPPVPGLISLTILLGVLSSLAALGTDVFLPAMPAIASAFDADARAVQFAVTTFFFGIALGQLFWGPLSDRYGRRPVLVAAMLLFLVASIACAFAPSVTAVVLGRFVQGLAMSSGSVVARAVVRDLYAHEQAARLLARMSIVFGVVPVTAPLVGGALVGLGWQTIFWFLSACALALLAAVAWRLPETAPSIGVPVHAAEIARRFRALLRDRRYLAPAAPLLAIMMAIVAFVSSSAFVLVQGMGVSPQRFALLFATVMIGQIGGAWLSSRMVLRLGTARLLRFGLALGLAAGLALAGLAWSGVNHPAAVVAPMVAFMFAASCVIPNAAAEALSPFPAYVGAAAALLGFLQASAGTLTSALLAVMFDGSARPMASVIALAALAAFASERVLLRKPVHG